MLGILAFAAGCDKAKAPRAAADEVRPSGAPALALANRPTLLFEVFGEREDPRVLPVAAIVGSSIVGIGLTERGWHALDSMYFAPGATLSLYRDGQLAGTATITRGMWTGEGPLQQLPGCAVMRPVAAARLETKGGGDRNAVEFVATSAPLTRRAASRNVMPMAVVDSIARAVGRDVAEHHGVQASDVDALEFTARALLTGAAGAAAPTGRPTIVASFMDATAGELGPGAGFSTNVLTLADQIDGSWQATYRHVASGDARAVEFQRLLDHLDLDGDGVDEVLLEAWHYAAESQLVVLRFTAGQWHETLRVPLGWCLDTKATSGRARP